VTSLSRETAMLFPESGVITVKDKRKWSPGREELGASWVITVGVDSVTAA